MRNFNTYNRNKIKRNKRKFATPLFFITLGFIVSLLLSGATFKVLLDEINGYNESSGEYEHLREENVQQDDPDAPKEVSNINHSSLYNINEDYLGWISVEDPDSLINYPLLVCGDADTYLHKSFEKKPNRLGSIFGLPPSNYEKGNVSPKKYFSSPIVMLFGHNAKNFTMFGTLHKIYDKSALPRVRIDTLNSAVLKYKTVFLKKVDTNHQVYKIKTQEDVNNFLKNSNVNFEGNPKLLVLSTCDNSLDESRRLILCATLEK
ncbi:MAG: class B sortase [Oscillospiraceae bacterium]|nr:class B sortase [Oscillospiraceae bacterium]